MSKIAVVFTHIFELAEYKKPAKILREAGHELIHVGEKEGFMVMGETEKKVIKMDKAVKDVSVEDFDALLIPGGYYLNRLILNQGEAEFVTEFVKSGKPVFGTRRKEPA